MLFAISCATGILFTIALELMRIRKALEHRNEIELSKD